MREHADAAAPPPAVKAGSATVRHDADTPLSRIRGAVAEARSDLEERFHGGDAVTALVAARSRFTDDVLGLAWRRFGLDAHPGCALVAVGGYGRGELHPHSDIDLLILTRKAMRGGDREKIKGFLAFLWDVGLAVGNSVRTVRECVDEARRDVTVATNLMESRLVQGSAPLLARMQERTGPGRIWSSRRFFEAKMREQRLRHHRFDDTGYNLEPNVKEGPGGLRDVQTVAWVARRHFGTETLGELVDRGFLTADELDALESGRRFLWRVRFALHVLARRAEDRLLFDHQRALAGMLGFEDGGGRLGVEHMMKRYYREVMELSRLNEMLLEHFEEAILHARRRERVKPLNRRFQAVNGYVEVTRKDVFRRYPFALLEVFLLLQQHPELEGVRASTIRLIRANRRRIDDEFRADLRARSLFLEILRQPRGINHELRRMHRYGILGAYLPVFDQVAGQMQYDLFHTYTVDEHSLFVVRNLRMLADPARHDEHPHCADIFARLPKPELIYVAGLFHDVAKGRGGDHSELGAGLVREFCALARLRRVRHQPRRLAGPLPPADVDHRPAPGHQRPRGRLGVRGGGRRSRPSGLPLPPHGRGHSRHEPRAVERLEGRPVARPLPIDGARAAPGARQPDRTGRAGARDPGRGRPSRGGGRGRRGAGRGAVGRLRRRLLPPPFGRRDPLAHHEHPRSGRPRARSLGDSAARNRGRPHQRRGRAGNGFVPCERRRRPSRAGARRARGRRDLRLRPGPEVPVRGQRLDPGAAGAHGARCEDHDRKPRHDPRFVRRRGRHGVCGRHGVRTPRASAHAAASVRAAAPLGAARREEIRNALQRGLRKPADVPRRVRRLPKRQLKHFTTPVEVNFTRDASNRHTVMEVIAADRPGLLARIGWALADARVRIRNAKIATFGERAEDVFYVTDAHDRPLSDARLEEVRRGVCAALES